MVYTIYLSITYIFNIKYKYELLKFREKKENKNHAPNQIIYIKSNNINLHY